MIFASVCAHCKKPVESLETMPSPLYHEPEGPHVLVKSRCHGEVETSLVDLRLLTLSQRGRPLEVTAFQYETLCTSKPDDSRVWISRALAKSPLLDIEDVRKFVEDAAYVARLSAERGTQPYLVTVQGYVKWNVCVLARNAHEAAKIALERWSGDPTDFKSVTVVAQLDDLYRREGS